MEILQGVWKQHLRLRAVVGYGVKIFLPSPPNYVTRSPGDEPPTLVLGWTLSLTIVDRIDIYIYTHFLSVNFPIN